MADIEGGSGFGNRRRAFALSVGDLCIVDPLNPVKKKHRGRYCEITAILEDRRVRVRFQDTNALGIVPAADLVGQKLADGSVNPEFQATWLRLRLDGPHRDKPAVHSLILKFLPVFERGDESDPDQPDYLGEAMLRANGLINRTEIETAKGELSLLEDKLRQDCVDEAVERLKRIPPEERNETTIEKAVNAGLAVAFARFEAAGSAIVDRYTGT